MQTASLVTPVLASGDRLGRLPVDEDPADFLPDPEGRANRVLHVPSCNMARGFKRPSGPVQTWPKTITYSIKIGENVTHGTAFLHNGVYYEATSGDVYNVHPATYERLTGLAGVVPFTAVPVSAEVTVTLKQQLDAQKAAMEAMQQTAAAMQAELAMLRAGKSNASANAK